MEKQKKKHGLKGIPDNWDEVKQRYNIALTPTAAAKLDAIAITLDVSRSELIERLGRNIDKILNIDELRALLKEPVVSEQELKSA